MTLYKSVRDEREKRERREREERERKKREKEERSKRKKEDSIMTGLIIYCTVLVSIYMIIMLALIEISIY